MATNKRYEYLSFRAQNAAETEGDNLLNSFGDLGWQLVTVSQVPDVDVKVNQLPQMDYYFVREKSDDADLHN